MSENKTKPTVASVAAFVEALPEQARRTDANALIKLMSKASGEKATLWGPSIIGFGTYHYRYESGREADTMLVGFSPRKAALVLYGVTGTEKGASLLSQLGRHTTGKGCLYIKKLSDIDQATLEQLIVLSVAAKKSRTA
jgi:hypothetical protein